MFHIILVHPEIPPNTGNVIRLAANTGCVLHLVKPLGFDLSEQQLRRAGLDYHDTATVHVHDNWADAQKALAALSPNANWFAMTTKASQAHSDAVFKSGDIFVLCSKTKGLPEAVRALFPTSQCLRLPMMPSQRSLNLSNSVAVTIYEAWRQHDFVGGA